jgi:hypothetical protein
VLVHPLTVIDCEQICRTSSAPPLSSRLRGFTPERNRVNWPAQIASDITSKSTPRIVRIISLIAAPFEIKGFPFKNTIDNMRSASKVYGVNSLKCGYSMKSFSTHVTQQPTTEEYWEHLKFYNVTVFLVPAGPISIGNEYHPSLSLYRFLQFCAEQI